MIEIIKKTNKKYKFVYLSSDKNNLNFFNISGFKSILYKKNLTYRLQLILFKFYLFRLILKKMNIGSIFDKIAKNNDIDLYLLKIYLIVI